MKIDELRECWAQCAIKMARQAPGRDGLIDPLRLRTRPVLQGVTRDDNSIYIERGVRKVATGITSFWQPRLYTNIDSTSTFVYTVYMYIELHTYTFCSVRTV